MTSVWECSRNDVLGALAVIVATVSVWLFESGWPVFLAAIALLTPFLRSATRVLTSAWRQLIQRIHSAESWGWIAVFRRNSGGADGTGLRCDLKKGRWCADRGLIGRVALIRPGWVQSCKSLTHDTIVHHGVLTPPDRRGRYRVVRSWSFSARTARRMPVSRDVW